MYYPQYNPLGAAGVIVFLFLLLVVVNRPVLYTVQVLGRYEVMSVEFCIICGCVINNVCPSV